MARLPLGTELEEGSLIICRCQVCIGRWTSTANGRGFQVNSRAEYYSRVFLTVFEEPPQPVMAVSFASVC